MIEGYSVKDAADILGIPMRRVWELIARGVLASSPEGPDGMLVYLQPHPAQQPTAPAPPIQEGLPSRTDEPDPPRHNGSGGASGEMSPFRELLTEFRSLTERYGQALLALGEARGEVAALRTRVELLEARMDVRLPSTRPASTVAWEIPDFVTEPASSPAPEPESEPGPTYMDEAPEAAATTVEPAELVEPEQVEPVEPTAEAVSLFEPEEAAVPDQAAPTTEVQVEELSPEAAPPIPDEVAAEAEPEPTEPDIPPMEPEPPAEAAERHAETRPRRSRGRPALAGFAEALARAQDPTIAELPGAEDAAQALAALRAEMEASREAAPSEEAPAPEPATDEAASEPVARDMSPYSTEIVEPDWFADGDFAWLEAEVTAAQTDVAAESSGIEAGGAEDVVQTDSAPVIAAPIEEAPIEELPPAPTIPEETAEAAEVAELPHLEATAVPELSEEAVTPEPFEPSPEAQAMAEEQARAAIQDAFEEPAAVTRDTVIEAETDQGPEPEPESEAIQEAFAEVEAPPAWPQADSAWADMEPELEAEWVSEPEPEAEPVAVTEPEAEPVAVTEPEAEPVAVAEPQAEPEAQPVALEEPPTSVAAGDVDVATPPEEFIAPIVTEAPSAPSAMPVRDHKAMAPAGEEELMWLGDEFEEAGLEVASEGWRSANAPGGAPPVLELSDAELSQLAEDEGWDMGEVEAIRSLLGRSSEVAPEGMQADPPEDVAEQGQANLPELADQPAIDETRYDQTWDETPAAEAWNETPPGETSAIETLASGQHESEPAATESVEEPAVEEAAAEAPTAEPFSPDPPAQDTEPGSFVSGPPPPPNPEPPSAIGSARSAMPPTRSYTAPTADPEWLKGRRGPAATAYRRLRRLFPS